MRFAPRLPRAALTFGSFGLRSFGSFGAFCFFSFGCFGARSAFGCFSFFLPPPSEMSFFQKGTFLVSSSGSGGSSSAVTGACTFLGTELLRRLAARRQVERRADDTDEAIKNRLRVYAAQTAPLLDYYRNHSLLVTVPGVGTVEAIGEAVRRALGR